MKENAYYEEFPKTLGEATVTKVWLNSEGNEIVYVYFKNNIWSFGFEYFSNHEYEMCWCSANEGARMYDSEETAIKELFANHPWSKEIEPKIL